VLALNVSVQATKAGVMGQECVVAAAEVEHLSGRTTEATRRITHLAHTIQRETHEVAIALEESTREMAQWVQAAAQAGRSLKEIEGVSSRLAELIQALGDCPRISTSGMWVSLRHAIRASRWPHPRNATAPLDSKKLRLRRSDTLPRAIAAS
jgi:methyl-accepting chemotaxis protein